jgi:hypothetical protein
MNVTVALMECSGLALNACIQLATATRSFLGLLTLYQPVDFNLGVIDENLSQSHSLEVWVVANASSGSDLWLAYDTDTYPSALTLT